MSEVIVRQPDGQLAVWDTTVDDWVIVDATPEALADRAVEAVTWRTRERVLKYAERVQAGRLERWEATFEDLQQTRLLRHGKAPWPPAWARDAKSLVESAPAPDLVGVTRQLLDGEVPEGGYWWTQDETCCPHYRGSALTAGELAALRLAVPDPADRRFEPTA